MESYWDWNWIICISSCVIIPSITAANIDATSTYLRVRDVAVSGNLTVSGTLTTIDTNNLQVKDSNIKLADQNSSSDLIDFGVYGQYSNGSTSAYAGKIWSFRPCNITPLPIDT